MDVVQLTAVQAGEVSVQRKEGEQMEMTIVMGSGAVRRDRLGAALPVSGRALRPRLGSAGRTALATPGGIGHAFTPTDPRPLDVTRARTS